MGNMESKIKRVIIINGNPGSGKDTFVKCLNEIVPTFHYSIIDCVRDLIDPVDDGKSKSEMYRSLLSDVKIILEEYNDYPFRDVTEVVCDFINDDLPHELLCIDMRECHDIERARLDFNAVTVFVERNSAKRITSNIADAGVRNCDYNFTVDNNGDISDLKKEAERFVDWITRIEYL